MLLIYNKQTREIVNIPYTHSSKPMGDDFETEFYNNVYPRYGGTIEDYGEYRLHDIQQRETVAKILNSASCEIQLEEGIPTGVITYERIKINCVSKCFVDEEIEISANASGGEGTEAVLFIDGVEQNREIIPATWRVIFETPGKYLIEVEAGKHGKVYKEVVVE